MVGFAQAYSLTKTQAILSCPPDSVQSVAGRFLCTGDTVCLCAVCLCVLGGPSDDFQLYITRRIEILYVETAAFFNRFVFFSAFFCFLQGERNAERAALKMTRDDLKKEKEEVGTKSGLKGNIYVYVSHIFSCYNSSSACVCGRRFTYNISRVKTFRKRISAQPLFWETRVGKAVTTRETPV